MKADQITNKMIIARANELIHDFGMDQDWVALARDGHELDALEFMALGYLMRMATE